MKQKHVHNQGETCACCGAAATNFHSSCHMAHFVVAEKKGDVAIFCIECGRFAARVDGESLNVAGNSQIVDTDEDIFYLLSGCCRAPFESIISGGKYGIECEQCGKFAGWLTP